jgi:predicted amidohydrolase
MSTPGQTTITVVADAFGRDLEAAYARIGRIVEEAAARGTDLLVLPDGTCHPPSASTAPRSPGWWRWPAT